MTFTKTLEEAEMPRQKKNWTLVIGVCIFVAIVGGVGHFTAQRFWAFYVEDRIHGTFYRVASALYTYQQDHEIPARSLADLVPEYVDGIPLSTLADRPTYSVSPDGQSWELVIHSRALLHPRLYICRSTQKFTPEETRRIIIHYHDTWTVFPVDR